MTRSEIRKEERRWRRGDFLVIVVAIVFGVAMAWIVLRVQAVTSDLQTQYVARDALARQVERLGGKPIAGPPGSRGEPGKSMPGPRGTKGEKGDRGASGKPAPTITPAPGASGRPGKDSTVPGPGSTIPGPSGAPGQNATGVPGEPGKDGTDGTNGKDGTDGRNGQPPAGWTYTDPAGTKYECTPADGFDPDAPRYDCRVTDPAPSDGDDEPAPQAAALDPTRRQYI